ncbi:MAPEG family protein [Sphingobium yanoikuyae]|nr:MAPEG family protein [Sphingobium yanoikuyae]
MSPDLYSLVATGLLLIFLAFVSTALYGKQVGNPALLGNREGLPEPIGAALRARRAHLNLLENAVPFAIAVFAARMLGSVSGIVATAAVVFVAARIVHAVAYIAGIAGVRTFAWLAGVVATIVIGFAAVA